MRGRTVVVSKVLQNIGSFRKRMFKELWSMPNVVLRYGSFNPTKRAEALVRAGELGAAVRALTSVGVLDAKDTSRNFRHSTHMKTFPMMPDSLDSMHGDSSSHIQTLTSADFRWSVSKMQS